MKFWQLLRRKLPQLISSVDTKTHRRPLLSCDMNANTTGGHVMATDAIKTNSDIIESNVFIDSSVKPNTYPIVSANMTQEMDKPLTTSQETSHIIDGTDSNDTAVNASTVQLMGGTFADQPLTSDSRSTACETDNGSYVSPVERMTDLVDNIGSKYCRRLNLPAVAKEIYQCLHTGCDRWFASRHYLHKHTASAHPQCPPQSRTDLGEHIGAEVHCMSAPMLRSCGHSVGINCQCLSSPPQQTFSLPVREATPVSVRVERNRGSDTDQRLAADRLPVYVCHEPGCDYKTNGKHGLVIHSHGVPEAKSHNKIIRAKTWTPEIGLKIHNDLRHTRTRNGQLKRYRCLNVDCRRRFVSLDKLHDHAVSVHQQRRYRYPYDRCGRSYATTDGLRVHTVVCHPKPSARTIGSDLLDTDFGRHNTANSGRHLSHDKIIGAKTRSPEGCLSPSDMCGQQLATYYNDDSDDTIEPNPVIDLNPTESGKQNTIVSADNGLEVLPLIGDDGTQAADNQFKTKQEIIDILDDSDSEDTAATPVTQSLPTTAITPMVPTANVHHYGSAAAVTVNQTADICLSNSLITQLLNKPTRNSLDTNGTSQATAPATDPEVYLCLECRKTFTTKHGLQTHNGMFHRKPVDQLHASGDQQSAAPVSPVEGCGQRFMFGSEIKSHMAYRHSSDRPFACGYPTCGYTCKTKAMLRSHKVRHTERGLDYRCSWPGCDRAYQSKSSLRGHFKMTHAADQLPVYACHWPGCDFKTKDKKTLKVHQLVHSSDRPYACEWPGCDYRGKCKRTIRQHLITHSTDRSLACDWPECGKTFKRTQLLKEHQLVHSGPQIPCDRKGCAFKTKHMSALKKHNRLIHKSD
ncbi:unnamed protein product [Medioppia subpectinata]|uniref:C2H2-type domain-containing protein n=1 Tax=Medioppia subpectinata TaxID=1979941 RepID=A0A7R9KMF8_9ACAR|nr:unnamed protein product [Medioppia subpectinata]CAG2105221.1 unnamed protein product [Medioppia subpectinata]